MVLNSVESESCCLITRGDPSPLLIWTSHTVGFLKCLISHCYVSWLVSQADSSSQGTVPHQTFETLHLHQGVLGNICSLWWKNMLNYCCCPQ